ncbi:LamG domain-containing protein [Microcoleus sp. A003_D6]|uniref:LamG domain-containing protein n=1 Tax=Microcoleus sp. A003_D6 TaxID=3055266 RepID=UPI002FD5F14D
MKNSVLTFDGIDDSVELSKGFPSIDKAITIEFWAKGENSLTQQTSVIEAHNAQNDRVLNIHFPWQHVANSRIFWDAGNENGCNRIDKEVKLEEYNGWTHWAFVKDTATGKMFIYRSGEIWHQGEGNIKNLGGINKFVIGSYVSGGQYWKGSLTEFRIWNTGRTQAEIKHNINSTLVGNESGLVGYYPFNGDSNDKTSNGNNGIINGAIWRQEELSFILEPPKAMQNVPKNMQFVLAFDGQDDFITCPEGIITASYTKEAWVKLTEPVSLNNNIISGRDHALFMPNGGFLASGHNNQWWLVKDSSASPANTWVHVAVTYDSQTKMMYLYRDGYLVSQASNVPPFNPSDRLLLIGSHHTVSLFKGQMAEARVWNKVLSQTEIHSNLSHRLVGNEPGLVGYWPLNDGEGAIAKDRTTNANHGTINGNPSWEPSTLSILDAIPSQPEKEEVPNSPGTPTQESPPTPAKISPAVNLPTDSKIKLKSWKGDYLHRPDSPQGVTTWSTGVGNEWTVEAIADNKIKLKSWKGDYLHRPDSPQGVTTWNTGVGNEWTVEAIADNKIKLKSWKGDYLHRPDSPPDVTTWHTGVGNEWEFEVISIEEPLTSTINTEMGNEGGVKFGTAVIQFDGETNYIEIPHQSVLGLTNNFTVEAWFNAQTLEGYRRMFSKFPGFGYGLVGSSLLFTTYWIQDYAAAAQLTAGTWYHLAIVFDASNSVYFYLNGSLVQTVAGESPATLSTGALEIGRKAEGHDEYWHGQLAELRLWNRAKTPGEILSGKSYSLVGDEPNLVGYWPLNEGVGTTIQDKTSNANHGSIRGNNVVWGLSTLELAAAELKSDRGTSSQAIEEQAQPSTPEGKEQIPSIPGAKVPSQGETAGKLETTPAPIIIEMESLSDEAVLEFFTKGNGAIYDSVDTALDQMKAQGAFARNAVPVFIVISGSVLGGQ